MSGSGSIGRPALAVTVDGTRLRTQPGRLRVRREVSSPAVCDVDIASAALDHCLPGQALKVAVDGSSAALFDGEIVSIRYILGPDGQRWLTLRGFDRSHRLRQRRSVTVRTDISAGDLAREICPAAGLSVDAERDGPRWPRLVQQGQSDLALLCWMAARAGLCWGVETDRLWLRDGASSADHRILKWQQDLIEAEVEISAAGRPERVRAMSWNPVDGEITDVTADNPISTAAVVDGLDKFGGDGVALLPGLMLAGPDHAQAMAQSELDRKVASAATLRAVVHGDPGLTPGTVVTLDGLGEDVAGPYVLTAVEHLVDDASGYVCIVNSESPEILPDASDSAMTMTVAQVTAVADPLRRGRVQVGLPTFDGAETEWLPVLALGAGSNKGLDCQPDIGDTVAVLMSMADPGRGIVLGGLRSGAAPQDDAGVADGGVRRFSLRAAGGQLLQLDRDNDGVLLANAGGSRLQMTDTGSVFHAAGDITIEAPGHTLRLRAARIDLEQA